MKIDWKEFAKSKGYRSLKKGYIEYLGYRRINKKESYELFQWVINRAKHYAIRGCVSVESVLDAWEEKRKYNIANHYYECNFPKSNSLSLKAISNKGRRKEEKSRGHYCKVTKAKRLQELSKKESTTRIDKKSRWSIERKKRGY